MHKKTTEQLRLAWLDLTEAVRMSWFWLALGWMDILQRYRGSLLGPFWLTITTAAFILGLGPLYAQLFNLNMAEYLPFLAIGFTAWGFISVTIIDCSNAFIGSGETLKQIRLPRFAIIFQVIWRNLIAFAHTFPIFAAVLISLGPSISIYMLLVIPGIILVIGNLIWIGVIVSIICARFRDIGPIIASIMQIAFFLTPIMWDHRQQRVAEIYVIMNPFAAYIELIRSPLLGEPPKLIFVFVAFTTLLVGSALAALLFVRARRRIIYWV